MLVVIGAAGGGGGGDAFSGAMLLSGRVVVHEGVCSQKKPE